MKTRAGRGSWLPVVATAWLAGCALRPAVAAARDPNEVSEVALGVGRISSQNDWPKSFAIAFSYRHVLNEHFSTTLAYLNHGHFPGHHRDGIAGEGWLQQDIGPVTLSAGAGYFYYFDTTVASHGGTFSDAHGWAPIYSLGAAYQPPGRRGFLELRLDKTAPAQSIETTSIALMYGYRMQPDDRRSAGHDGEVYHQWEWALYGGKTVVNSFSSQSSRALSTEVRYAFGDFLRGSAAYLNEGDAQLIRRNGALVEGWLEPGFSGDAYTVGAGVGAYAAIDKYRQTAGRHLSGVVSLTLSARLHDHWSARLDWHRIVTNYDRDTDILLGGIGYRFK